MRLIVLDSETNHKKTVHIQHKPVDMDDIIGIHEIFIEVAAILKTDCRALYMEHKKVIKDGSTIKLHYSTGSGKSLSPEFLHITDNHRSMCLVNEYTTGVHHRINGRTCLMSQAHAGHVSCVDALIKMGSDVHAVDQHGWSVLRYAIYSNSFKTVKKLIHAGAKVPINALMESMQYTNVRILNLLISKGADVNHIDAYGFTPLIIAMRDGTPECVSKLIEYGANVNSQEWIWGWNAFMHAYVLGRMDNINALPKMT